MDVGLISDLHIEVDKAKDLYLPGGEILLLAGDLCEVDSIKPDFRIKKLGKNIGYDNPAFESYERSIKLQSKELLYRINKQLNKYERVFSVLGNHEHYNGDYDITSHYYKEILPNVILLENEWVNLSSNVVLFGATLWSDLNKGDPMTEISSIGWSDYNHIKVGDRLLSTKDTLAAFNKTLASLFKCAEENKDKDIVVMTHFTPSLQSIHPKFRMSADNGFFSSDLDDVIYNHPNIKIWCHGHTHELFDYHIGQCRILCNPRGYPNEGKSKFNEGFSFNI